MARTGGRQRVRALEDGAGKLQERLYAATDRTIERSGRGVKPLLQRRSTADAFSFDRVEVTPDEVDWRDRRAIRRGRLLPNLIAVRAAILHDALDPERVHLAFQAPDRETVARFHAAGLSAGGTHNGAPGERPYHPGYYGAFLIDPDGNNIEAVYHGPAQRSAASVELSWQQGE